MKSPFHLLSEFFINNLLHFQDNHGKRNVILTKNSKWKFSLNPLPFFSPSYTLPFQLHKKHKLYSNKIFNFWWYPILKSLTLPNKIKNHYLILKRKKLFQRTFILMAKQLFVWEKLLCLQGSQINCDLWSAGKSFFLWVKYSSNKYNS